MKFQLFLEKSLAIHLYYSHDSVKFGRLNVKKLYVIFPGLPQSSDKEYFKDKISKDVAFMYVYYYGSWYSNGKFTFRNCQKTIVDVLAFVKKGRSYTTFSENIFYWKYDSLILVASSFGAAPLLTTQLTRKDADKILLLFPFIFLDGRDLKKILPRSLMINFYKKMLDSLAFLKRGYRNLYRGITNPSWSKLFSGSVPTPKIQVNNEYPPVCIYHDKSDPVVPYRISIALNKTYPNVINLKPVKGIGQYEHTR